MTTQSVFLTVQSLLRSTLVPFNVPFVLCDLIHGYLPNALQNKRTPSKIERFVLERFAQSQNPHSVLPPPLTFPPFAHATTFEVSSNQSHVWRSDMSESHFVAVLSEEGNMRMMIVPLREPGSRWYVDFPQTVPPDTHNHALEVRGDNVMIPLDHIYIYSLSLRGLNASGIKSEGICSIAMTGTTLTLLRKSSTGLCLMKYTLPAGVLSDSRTLSSIITGFPSVVPFEFPRSGCYLLKDDPDAVSSEPQMPFEFLRSESYLLDRNLIIPNKHYSYEQSTHDCVYDLDSGAISIWPHVGTLRSICFDGENTIAVSGNRIVTFFAESRSVIEVPSSTSTSDAPPPALWGSHMLFNRSRSDIGSTNILAAQPGPLQIQPFNRLLFQSEVEPSCWSSQSTVYKICSGSITVFQEDDFLVVMAQDNDRTFLCVYPLVAPVKEEGSSCVVQ